MQKNIKKATSIILICILIMSLSVVLFSCNKNDGAQSNIERNNAVSSFKSAVLTARSADWEQTFSDEQLAKRVDAAEYVQYSAWLDFLGETIYSSDLHLAQINKLTEIFGKEDIKDAFKKEENEQLNKEKNKQVLKIFFPLLKYDFTVTDISNLIYNTLEKLSLDSSNVFKNMYERAEKLLNVQESTSVRNMFNSAMKSYSLMSVDQSLVDALRAAEGGVKSLTGFMYDTVLLSISDDLFQSISSGALTDITENEIKLTLNSILNNVLIFKNSLTDKQLNAISTAFSKLTKQFNGVLAGSGILQNIMNYVSIGYTAIDFIPLICDVVLDGKSVIETDGFVSDLLEVFVKDGYNLKSNYAVLLARFMEQALSSYASDNGESAILKFNQLFDKINSIEDPEIRTDKLLGFLVADIGLNSFIANGTDRTEALPENPEMIPVLELSMTYISIQSFKSDFRSTQAGFNVSGDEKFNGKPYKALKAKFDASYSSINSVLEFELPTLTVSGEGGIATENDLKNYFTTILNAIEDKLPAKMSKAASVAKEHLSGANGFIAKFFKEQFSVVKEIAKLKITNDKTSEEYVKTMELLKKLEIDKYFA